MPDGNHTNSESAQDVSEQEMTQHTTDSGSSHRTGKPALQIVCLGSGGGPSEDNVSGFLVRSLSSGWSKGSLLAVDAGSHLAAITRVLERSFPLYSETPSGQKTSSAASPTQEGTSQSSQRKSPTVLKDGPFAGVKFPHESARANALHLLHTYVSTYLITHPHLDHLSGFAINTAAFHGRSRPKTLAALPSTVDAVKRHIFNDVIWPNLSDEDGGVGFVTFQRLKEGGDPMVGEGEGRGYIDVCDGLGVKAFSVSHGVCTKTPPTHQHRGSISNGADLAAAFSGSGYNESMGAGGNKSMSMHERGSTPSTPGANRRMSFQNLLQSQSFSSSNCVVDSTAFFLRDEETAREVLIFGDIEPDSISLSPRNEIVWTEAARKVTSGILAGILIECSYTDAATDEALFGHLCPRHVIAELLVLGQLVQNVKLGSLHPDSATKKRKRSGVGAVDSPRHGAVEDGRKRVRSVNSIHPPDLHIPDSHKHTHDSNSNNNNNNNNNYQSRGEPEALSPRALGARQWSSVPSHNLPAQAHQSKRSSISNMTWDDPPLAGVTVVIIHVKDTFKDGPPVSETIAAQLEEHEADCRAQGQALGCKFVISQPGQTYWF